MAIDEVHLAPTAARPAVAVMAMVALAALDLVGALLARRYADHRSILALVGGCCVFALLFLVYGASLAYAELVTVTFGWVVLLQVGVVLIERVLDGVAIPPDRVAVMSAIVVLQGYLLLAPRG